MAEQSDNKICLKCQHVNPETATVCENCGASLRPTTVPVPDLQLELTQQAQKPVTRKKTGELVRQIALWVRNEPKPVLIDIGRGHVLGRRTSASDPPDLVDLTEYGAYRLGVSRRHSQFECTEAGCIVIDLGSSNGTWVNGLRLEPYQPAHVKSGDRINLGRMEFSIGYALSDAPSSGPVPEMQAQTAPHILPSGTGPLTSQGKVDTEPDAQAPKPAADKPAANAATSTMQVDTQPEEGTPDKADAAKEMAQHPAVAPSAEVKPGEAKPAEGKPAEVKPPDAKPAEAESAAVKPPPATLAASTPPVQNQAASDKKPSEADKKPPEGDKKPSEGDKKPPESGA
jgi:ribosomal protein L40E